MARASSVVKRTIKGLGKNKYFKNLTQTAAKQSGVPRDLQRAAQYIKDGKKQISVGKEMLRTGKIPGTDKIYSKEIVTKRAKDKIRLGKANKLTGVTIYRKLRARGLDLGGRQYRWTGRPWSFLDRARAKPVVRIAERDGRFGGSRDLGWGKISSKPSLGKSSFGEGLSRGLIKYKTQKLKRGKGIFGQGSRGTMVR